MQAALGRVLQQAAGNAKPDPHPGQTQAGGAGSSRVGHREHVGDRLVVDRAAESGCRSGGARGSVGMGSRLGRRPPRCRSWESADGAVRPPPTLGSGAGQRSGESCRLLVPPMELDSSTFPSQMGSIPFSSCPQQVFHVALGRSRSHSAERERVSFFRQDRAQSPNRAPCFGRGWGVSARVLYRLSFSGLWLHALVF